jgi:ABC-type multidrug transport system ATPase subunit
MVGLKAENLTFGYNRSSPLFDNLDLVLGSGFEEGRVVALMGRSGSGKTTLLRLLAGLEAPWSGCVKVNPEKAQFSILAQEAMMFEHLSVVENARYFERIKAVRDRIDGHHLRALSEELDLLEIFESRKAVSELSGGERQRLALFRSLSIRPEILFLDEPCAGLDVVLKVEFLSYLRAVVQSQGILAIYVTHHMDEAQLVADDVVFLLRQERETVRKIWKRELSDFLTEPPHVAVAELLLGPVFNRLECSFSSKAVRVPEEGGQSLGRLDECLDFGVEDVGFIGFRPEQVNWNEGGVAVDWRADSSAYSFCIVRGSERRGKIVGPRSRARPTSFRLHGRVILFGASGCFVGASEIRNE